MKVVVDILNIISELESQEKEFYRLSYVFFQNLGSTTGNSVTCCTAIMCLFISVVFLVPNCLEIPENETKVSNKTNHDIFGVHKR